MKLLFVYNAKSGGLNLLLDIGHKALSPNTYSCHLCSITHNILGEKQAWKSFRTRSQHELEFLHKDEFEKHYRSTHNYPVILKFEDDSTLSPVLTSADINQCDSVDSLIEAIQISFGSNNSLMK
ncbi:MAG: GTPase [Verrucomicrobiota bacterium]